MTSHSAILCVTLGKVSPPASLAQALTDNPLHQVASLKEAERLLVLQLARVGLLLIGAELSEPPAALEEFLLRHWQVRWIALLPPGLLRLPYWRALVHAHCHDFHTLPLDLARLGQTLGHAQGLSGAAEHAIVAANGGSERCADALARPAAARGWRAGAGADQR